MGSWKVTDCHPPPPPPTPPTQVFLSSFPLQLRQQPLIILGGERYCENRLFCARTQHALTNGHEYATCVSLYRENYAKFPYSQTVTSFQLMCSTRKCLVSSINQLEGDGRSKKKKCKRKIERKKKVMHSEELQKKFGL